MGYLKQGEVNANGKRAKKPKAGKSEDWRSHYHTREEMEAALTNSHPVADAINGLASVVSTYVTQARNGDNGHSLYTTPNGYPVKIAFEDDLQSLTLYLEGEAVESIADSLKRIADAMAGRKNSVGGDDASV